MNDVKTKYGINNKVVRASEKTEDGRVVNTKAYNCWKNMMNTTMRVLNLTRIGMAIIATIIALKLAYLCQRN